MNDDHPHLVALRQRHEELDQKIAEVESHPSADTSEIRDLKRKKLQVKEEITSLSAAS